MNPPFRWRQKSDKSIHLTLEMLVDDKYVPIPMFNHDATKLLNEHPQRTARLAKQKAKRESKMSS